MNFVYRVATGLITTLIAVFQAQLTWAQNASAIEDVATKITVRIKVGIPDITGETFRGYGSGVIVKGSDGNYYVVTNAHVLKNPRIKYQAEIFTEDPLISPIQTLKFIARLDDGKLDLAIAVFVNQQNYTAATLGDATNLKSGDAVYVAGFLAKTQRFQFISLIVNNPTPIELGVPIFYVPKEPDKNVQMGQSGGPVLNQLGDLVGIHRGEQSQSAEGNGISVNTILSTFTQLQPQINSRPNPSPNPSLNPAPTPALNPTPTPDLNPSLTPNLPVRGLY